MIIARVRKAGTYPHQPTFSKAGSHQELRGCKLSGIRCLGMDTKTHWDEVYATKKPEAVSWYRAHLETSLALIERAAHSRSASIIDIGGGESTLVDDLLA